MTKAGKGRARNRKPSLSTDTAGLRRRAEADLRANALEKKHRPMMAELRRQVEARTPKRPANPRKRPETISESDSHRLLHELQVHQVELEMQNAELQESRDQIEKMAEKYTDLYDFAPVGYFSLNEEGRIREANLTGAALLGRERSLLINQPLTRFAMRTSQPLILAFLERIFAGSEHAYCEATLLREGSVAFPASLHGNSTVSVSGPEKRCRVTVSDITILERAEKARHHLEILAASNQELKQEIVRRQGVEKALKLSELHKSRLLKRARQMQEQLRHLSHQILQAQEDERKRISRDLHDEVTQALVGINVHLQALSRKAGINPKRLQDEILQAQRLVEKSVETVHQFARELRPTALDDLGLIATLHSLLKDFMKRTGIRVQFSTFAGVEELNNARRTVLYRVVQSALSNVAEHANASRVAVNIRAVGKAVRMDISDDGKAFDVDRVLHNKRNRRLGLLGMRERLEMVGGSFDIVSAPGHGTTVHAEIPLGPLRKTNEMPLIRPVEVITESP